MNKPAKQNEYNLSAKQLNPLLSDKQSLSDTKVGEVDYKNISIPGAPLIEEIFDVLESQNESTVKKHDFGLVKIHKENRRILLEGDTDLFVFKEPSIEKKQEKKSILTQIPTGFKNQKDSKKDTIKENIFLNQAKPKNRNTSVSGEKVTAQKNKQSTTTLLKNNYKKQQPVQKSSNFIIATLFLLVFVSAVFVLQAANILDLGYIASLFDSKNYSAEVTNETTTMSELIKSNML